MKVRALTTLILSAALALPLSLVLAQAAPTTGGTSVQVLGSVAKLHRDGTISARVKFTCPAGMPWVTLEITARQGDSYSEAFGRADSCTGKVQLLRVTSPGTDGTLVARQPTDGIALIYFSCPSQETEACGGSLRRNFALKLV